MHWTEAEKKFTFNFLPYNILKFLGKTTIYRKYLCTEPEIRINKRVFQDGEIRCHIVLKKNLLIKNGLITREKHKQSISLEEFNFFSDMIDIPLMIIDNFDFYLDENHNICFKYVRDTDINYMEIEFNNNYDWLIIKDSIYGLGIIDKDVSNNPNFMMKNVWKNHFMNDDI